ncbi:DMT family transporter [Acetobacter sp. TBRC 12305]|uniref:DMT family transporter n=1 Tax=Acetobacter garciniae TaxID=2817435 RepID=A0A939KR85_9PROT|nr:DMT family transporter [Acetobacter garciniae]MBO1324716.1 DMT family transporter [Acetobacter garciniae]MBX0344407.1 DMT family transporter [Acetobacter garciniae]
MNTHDVATPRLGTRQLGEGIACGMGAGALWGVIFLAPELIGPFTPMELASGRYLFYGLFALVLIAPRWGRISRHIAQADWWRLGWLSLAGNTAYYVLLCSAVRYGGVAMTSLVTGFLPVVVACIGSRGGHISLTRLLPGMALCVAGAACIAWQAMAIPASAMAPAPLGGLACALAALLCWAGFAVGNARAMALLDQIGPMDWSLLMGLVTAAQALVLAPVAFGLDRVAHSAPLWWRFGLVCAGVAVLASIGGTALWNRMSQLLPLTLAGHMVLFETLFALLYGFVWEQRLPTVLESLAFCCVMLSLLACVRAHGTRDHAAGQGDLF